MTKLAVVLFNMGGPDRPESVRPFLFNLFNDPAIIGAPQPIRRVLAEFISRKRAPTARRIYEKINGRSPLLELTKNQAAALEERLRSKGEARVFIAMRYWHPFSDEAAAEVASYHPDEIVLLPLYPQFSTATTGSSLKDWRRAAAAAGIAAPTYAVCCYPDDPGFIEAQRKPVLAGIEEASRFGAPRVLFSAHGLPKKVVERGDPYARQVERTAEAVVKALNIPALDRVVCYQSKVGPMEWIGPATTDELKRAAVEQKPVVVVPIAFVSEHSETLVELDIEYRELALEWGVSAYVRVATVGTAAEFIDGLAGMVERAAMKKQELISGTNGRLCPAECGRCPHE
ncbi:MAG: ferrochelatase [Rhodospirillales bacterium RIFCSPLOWO2_12_FULL_58_28]|nr:MAG: ferrochelatase [Rhodospirillales bacterium RIFCSPLOWO2_02_FULL_58_16]OHC79856.1 MAG: ferrochelatase [Rhodospirillales bacterium RIFCSPLOWO2_12_FULL_58_28]